MIDPEGCPKVRFSTADLPEQDRLAGWRELYAQTVFRGEITPACNASFKASVVSRALPNLHLRYGALSAVRVARTREFLADGNNDLALVINRAGHIVTRARGREVALPEGDGVLVNSGEMTTFERTTFGGSFSVRIPHSVLSSLVVDVDDAVMRPLSRGQGSLGLLTSYVGSLLNEDAPMTPELRRLAVTHAHDLVALTLGATREVADMAQKRGVCAARLKCAKAYVVENCGHPSLSVGTAAKHLGITPRHLQKLFEHDGSTFSTFLLGQRLARAHRMLTNPKFDPYPVSTIAYEVGFGDLSYFNRSFRQRYGATPREARHGATK